MMVTRDANYTGYMVKLFGAFGEDASGTAAPAAIVAEITSQTSGARV
jgi:hypothetical protein